MAFATKTGCMGVSVPVLEVGDVVAMIYGMTGPFILRPVNDGTYHMVGFAYLGMDMVSWIQMFCQEGEIRAFLKDWKQYLISPRQRLYV